MTIVKTEALAEFFPEAAAPEYFHEITGQEQQEADWPEQGVNETNHSVAAPGSEALAEFFPEAAAPEHFHEMTGQEQQEADWPEQFVHETNHSVAARGSEPD